MHTADIEVTPAGTTQAVAPTVENTAEPGCAATLKGDAIDI
jgi:hypothetical protein